MSTRAQQRNIRKRRWIVGVIAGAVFLAALIAIGYQSTDLVLVRTEEIKAVPLADVLARNFNPMAAKSDVVLDIATLAALAANVYEPTGTYDSGCSPNAPGRISLRAWEQIRGWSYPEACNAALNGLHYEVWHRIDSEGIRYVAVVFRGTVPSV